MHKRPEKVAETIHELVSELLVKGLKDPRIGFVTITGVKMTNDLHLATIYFTVIGDGTSQKSSEKGLNSAKGFIRKEIGKNLHMRYIPDLIFRYDESVEYGRRIETILNELSDREADDNREDQRRDNK
jgi:ribosome-binding factor A